MSACDKSILLKWIYSVPLWASTFARERIMCLFGCKLFVWRPHRLIICVLRKCFIQTVASFSFIFLPFFLSTLFISTRCQAEKSGFGNKPGTIFGILFTMTSHLAVVISNSPKRWIMWIFSYIYVQSQSNYSKYEWSSFDRIIYTCMSTLSCIDVNVLLSTQTHTHMQFEAS